MITRLLPKVDNLLKSGIIRSERSRMDEGVRESSTEKNRGFRVSPSSDSPLLKELKDKGGGGER